MAEYEGRIFIYLFVEIENCRNPLVTAAGVLPSSKFLTRALSCLCHVSWPDAVQELSFVAANVLAIGIHFDLSKTKGLSMCLCGCYLLFCLGTDLLPHLWHLSQIITSHSEIQMEREEKWRLRWLILSFLTAIVFSFVSKIKCRDCN